MFFSTCFSTNSKNYSRIEIASPLGLVLCHRKLTSTNGLVSYLHKDDLPTEAYRLTTKKSVSLQKCTEKRTKKNGLPTKTVNYLEMAKGVMAARARESSRPCARGVD